MTQHPCIRQLSGLKGMTIRTSPNSAIQLLACLIQAAVIYLATDGSHEATVTLQRSLSSRTSAHSTSSTRTSNHNRVGLSSSYENRMYENSLDSATFVEGQATRRRSVNPGHSKPAEVISLMARQRNPPSDSTIDSIIRETSIWATDEV